MKYCTNCGTQNSDNAQFCSKCGTNLAQQSTQKEKPKKKKGLIIAVVIIAIFVIFWGIGKFAGGNTDTNKKAETVATVENFDYELKENTIELKSYKGNESEITIESTYDIDNKTYSTDLSEFRVGSNKVDTIKFAEGIKKFNLTTFNSCSVTSVYFPASIEQIYDYSLAYLHPDKGSKIKIYYADSEDKWKNVFTTYTSSNAKEEWENGNYEEAGVAAANSLNEKIGTKYDSSNFEFHFNYSE